MRHPAEILGMSLLEFGEAEIGLAAHRHCRRLVDLVIEQRLRRRRHDAHVDAAFSHPGERGSGSNHFGVISKSG
jgi:hypothetical protein